MRHLACACVLAALLWPAAAVAQQPDGGDPPAGSAPVTEVVTTPGAQRPVPPVPSPPAVAPAPAPETPPDDEDETDIFGFHVPHTDRFRISGTFIAGWSHDGAQSQLGFEKQGRVGQATITFTGRLNPKLSYRISLNPMNEASSKPSCGEEHFFYPNDPSFYTAGPAVPCDPEQGTKRVDTYNTYALDYLVQQGPFREGYVDYQATDALSARFGRFILPIGFAPEEVGSWTAKDVTRIQRLNAEANFGLMLGWRHARANGEPLLDAAMMAVLGEGNREKDYDWFYFADPTLDSNSALTAVATVRARPVSHVDVRVAYKKGFTGSKVERLPSYWASKRVDDALVVSAKAQPHEWVTVFGEYARYVWGPTKTSAELVGLADTDPIVKPGYYLGGKFEYPLTERLKVGMTFTREELSRDDSLIKYLALNGLYGVEMGRKDRGTIARFYVDVSRVATLGFFWADVSNPYPWVSGSWPVSGERAFTGRAPDRYGFAVILKTP
ncbi:MAG: hypothetical protein AB7O67_03730 [Vicinamibacterales bacterium]